MKEIIKHRLQFKAGALQSRDLKKIVLIILHHQCGKGQSVEQIHAAHLKRGWAGIGYHFFIDVHGNIHEGRPIDKVGSHCAGNNTSSIGICLEGDFRTDKPTKEQIESMNELIKFLRGKVPTIKRVLNHRDLYATACPVIDLKAMVK